MLKKLAFVCTIAAAFVLFTSAKPSPAKKFDKEVTAMVKDMDAVGMTTTVVSGNKIIFTKAWGVKNLETQEPLTTDTYFRAGLVGRTIIPMAIIQCYDNGLLDLKDDVSKYLGFELRNPNYPDVPVTISMLLKQNSSLMDANGFKSLDDLKNPELEGLWSDSKPGAKYKKCSKGFVILAAIVEKATGVPFEEYAQSYIFGPLGIDASYTPSNYKDNRVASYVYKDGQYEKSKTVYTKKKIEDYTIGESTFKMGTTSMLMIKPDDMAKIVLTLMNEGECPLTKTRLYSKAASEKFLKPNKANTRCLGIGVTTKAVEGATLYYTSGIHNGTYVYFTFDPAAKLGIVAFTNGVNNKDWVKEMRDAYIKAFY